MLRLGTAPTHDRQGYDRGDVTAAGGCWRGGYNADAGSVGGETQGEITDTRATIGRWKGSSGALARSRSSHWSFSRDNCCHFILTFTTDPAGAPNVAPAGAVGCCYAIAVVAVLVIICWSCAHG